MGFRSGAGDWAGVGCGAGIGGIGGVGDVGGCCWRWKARVEVGMVRAGVRLMVRGMPGSLGSVYG